MLRVSIIAILAVAIAAGCALWYGTARWRRATQQLQLRLLAARVPIAPSTYHASELVNLPAPVQRYLRTVLTEAQSIIAIARFTQSGTFNMGETTPNWRGFSSTQVVVTRRPGFVWDARIGMAPGVRVFVHDAYIAGAGLLHAEVMGLVAVADQRDTADLARGELWRYLAEALWYPTALLPSQGVAWSSLDASSARATLGDGDTTVSLDFHFNAEGLIDAFSTSSRPRSVDGGVVDAPWGGRMWGYAQRDGMLIPLEGEVSWILPGGPYPYWRGRMTQIEYEFER